jgi:ankyrin repeat protein
MKRIIFGLLVLSCLQPLSAMDRWAQLGLDIKLCDAVWKNKKNEVRALIKKGADVNCQLVTGLSGTLTLGGYTHHHNISPLSLAIRKRLTPLIKILLEAGANPNAEYPYYSNRSGSRPLCILEGAVKDGTQKAVALLLAYCGDLTEPNKHVHTALILAIQHGNYGAVSELIKAGANIWIKATEDDIGKELANKDALTVAREKGYQDIIQILKEYKRLTKLLFRAIETENEQKPIAYGLSIHPYLLNNPNKKGITPLICAIQNGKFEICRLLLKKGALTHLRDNNGLTAFDHANAHEQPEILELLQLYAKDTLKNRCLRTIIEADESESAKIFDERTTEAQLSVLPSFVEIVEIEKNGNTHENN